MAFVNFDELSEGLDAMPALKPSRICSKPLSIVISLSSVSKYSLALYTALADSIQEATVSFCVQYKSVTVSA